MDEAVGAAILEKRRGRMGKQGSVQRCWPEHLSPLTGSSRGWVSLAKASQEGSPSKTTWKTSSHGA